MPDQLLVSGVLRQDQPVSPRTLNPAIPPALDEIIMKEARLRLTLYTQDEAKGLAKDPAREKLERELLEKGLRFYEQLPTLFPHSAA